MEKTENRRKTLEAGLRWAYRIRCKANVESEINRMKEELAHIL